MFSIISDQQMLKKMRIKIHENQTPTHVFCILFENLLFSSSKERPFPLLPEFVSCLRLFIILNSLQFCIFLLSSLSSLRPFDYIHFIYVFFSFFLFLSGPLFCAPIYVQQCLTLTCYYFPKYLSHFVMNMSMLLTSLPQAPFLIYTQLFSQFLSFLLVCFLFRLTSPFVLLPLSNC